MPPKTHTPKTPTPSRRTVLAGAAWSAPVIVVATSTSAAAVSPVGTLTRDAPTASTFNEDKAAQRSVAVRILSGSTGVSGQPVVFSVSPINGFLSFANAATTSAVTTDAQGRATAVLVPAVGATPVSGDQVTVTATYAAQTISWVVTYLPFQTLTGTGQGVFTLALAGARVFGWGVNTSGQIGTGSTSANVPTPSAAVGSLTGKTVVAVAHGSQHGVALDSTGVVHTWGINTFGQLGDGSTTTRPAPVAVPTAGTSLVGRTVVAVRAGGGHTMAVDSTGAVHVWGDARFGQLGNGSSGGSVSPVLKPSLVDPTSTPMANKTIVAVTAGNLCTIALASDGTMFSWGYNEQGQLGDGSVTTRVRPVAVTMTNVPAGSKVVALSTGDAHVLARTDTGRLLGWGFNSSGGLGLGDTASRLVPTLLGTNGLVAGQTVVSAAAGSQHSVAALANGAVYAWGRNAEGQVGDGTTTDRLTPTLVGGLLTGKTAVVVGASALSSFVLTDEPLAYAWGRGADGDLGNATTSGSGTPTRVRVAGG